MTNREFFVEIAATESLPLAIREHAEGEIAKLDKRNAARAEKPSKTAIANEPIKAKILEELAAGGKTASDLAVILEVSVQKASALCRQLADAGQVTATEVKIPKKGKQKMYALAVVEENEESEVTED